LQKPFRLAAGQKAGTPRPPSRVRRLVTLLVPLTIVMGLTLTGMFKFLDYKVHDLAFKAFPRTAQPGLLLVEIDATSLLALEHWPWPRSYHAKAIDILREAGASKIAIDIDFSSRSTDPEDRALADALRRAGGSVILPAFTQLARGTMGSGTILSEPLAQFRDNVALASVNVRPARDGLVRQTTIAEPWRSGSIASMAAQLAGSQGNAPHFNTYALDFGIDIGAIPALSFVDLLTGNFDPAIVHGRNVMIGATAVELKDVLPVPIYRAMSGVHLHAVAYQSLIQGRTLQSPAAATTALILLLLNFLLGPVFERLSWQRGLFIVAAFTTTVIALHLTLYVLFPVLFDVIGLISLISLLYIATIISRVDRQTILLLLQDAHLKRVDAMMRTTVECSFDSILTIDNDHRIVIANAAACHAFGADETGLAGLSFSELMPKITSFCDGDLDYTSDHISSEARRLDGSVFPAEIAISKSEDATQEFHIAVIRDASRRHEQERRLKHLARHDALTGLPNRLTLNEALERAYAVAETGSFALLVLDLDRFKEVNDTLGHHTGDRLLVAVAKRLRRIIGDDAVFARLGGDEFAILQRPPTSLNAAQSLACSLSDALNESFDFGGMSLALNASIGIALYPDHASSIQQLFQCADIAMYQAKAANEDFAVYDVRRDLSSVRHLALTGQLSRAIDERQIHFYYQPKIDLKTGRMCGVEALARWDHPKMGLVTPDEFIRVAENTGLIRPLTVLAIETVVKDVADWQRQGVALTAAVNIAAQTVQDASLPNLIHCTLAEHAIHPEAISLEITESTIMRDPEGAASNLRRVSELGIRLSIDDFGTGYSSLSYLGRLPVSELKIDQSFVAAMKDSVADETIVRSTIDLAHNLGLEVVAEGIETMEQMQALVELGCDIGQGYFFSRPLSPDDFLEQIAKHGKKAFDVQLERPQVRSSGVLIDVTPREMV
jgi:diguanylate cyclase (GGDEF)-like protein/PAS domain S-box-containing protein